MLRQSPAAERSITSDGGGRGDAGGDSNRAEARAGDANSVSDLARGRVAADRGAPACDHGIARIQRQLNRSPRRHPAQASQSLRTEWRARYR